MDRLKGRLPLLGPALHMFSNRAIRTDPGDATFGRYSRRVGTGDLPPVGGKPFVTGVLWPRRKAEVQNGRSLSDAFRTTDYFPVIVTNLIEIGETSGALVPMLNGVAEFYEEDANTRLASFIALIDPILIFVLATIVTVVLLAFYLPQFSLVGQIG